MSVFLIKLFFGLILTNAVNIGNCLTYNVSLEKELFTQLFERYNKYIIPRYNISFPTVVDVSVFFLYLDDVDIKSQTFTVRLFLRLDWIDHFLTWDPDLYSGVNIIRAPHDIIWIPDIHIDGAVGKVTDFGQDGTIADVYSSGSMVLWPSKVHKISCVFDIRKYPFDVQKCCLDMSSWTYHNKSVVLQAGLKQIYLHVNKPNGEWHIEVEDAYYYTVSHGGIGYSHVVFPFILRRKWQFVVLNTFFPTVCTSLLTLLCFCLPNESGERVSLSISIFLTLAVFMTVTSVDLPRTADAVSLLGAYIALQLAWSGITIVLTVVSLAAAHRKQNIPAWIYRLLYRKTSNKVKTTKQKTQVTIADSVVEGHATNVSFAENSTDIDNIDKGEMTWENISSILNSVFLYGCLLWHSCLHVWFLIQIYT